MKEEKEKKIKQSVTVTEVGATGYRVERATNFLDLKMGFTIKRDAVEALIEKGIQVTIVRNK